MATDEKQNCKTPESFFEWIRNHFPQAGGFVDLSAADDICNIGSIENADGYGKICGICGDTMEIWLKIDGDVVTDARFKTNGCFSSQVCGSAATFLAKGEPLIDALAISPRGIMDLLELVPGVEVHCSILATSALFRAIAEYLLKNDRGHHSATESNDSHNKTNGGPINE